MKFSSGLASAILAFSSLSATTFAHSIGRSALDYFSTVDAPSINTPSNRVHAHSEFDITFSLHRNKQHIRLTLEPNHDIIPENAVINYMDAHGNIHRSESFHRSNHKVFKGSAWVETGTTGHWTYAGWSRINVLKDGQNPHFEGAFELGPDTHHIQTRSGFMSKKHKRDPDLEAAESEYMVVWRDSDVSTPRKGDAYTSFLKGSHDFFTDSFSHELAKRDSPSLEQRDITVRADAGSWGVLNTRSLFSKRQSIDGSGTGGNQGIVNLKNAIGNTAGCPITKKVALMGVATDCTYTGTFNGTDAARDNIITQVNSASSVYESTFNITLGLANITIMDANCPGSAAQATPWNIGCNALNVSSRLTAFSKWRGDQGGSNAFWTLLSNCPTGEEVGLSWTGALCQQSVDPNGGASANIVVKTSTEWQVIAHEVGHTFGAVHDCDDQTCAQANIVNSQQCCPVSASSCDARGQFLMNPSIGSSSITRFSPCTVGNICSAMQVNSVNSTCLVDNSKVPLITKQQCGNGIVEPGEDCDCGGTASCGNNQCCDPGTCKFKNNAVCDDANEECCRSCQFASQGVVCRASTGTCDPQETCTGNTGACPADVTSPDGQGCGTDMQCASGQCTSRDLQCKQLMGTSFSDGKNDTYACDSQSCTIRCASPEFGPNTCFEMSHNFLDGTNCGGDGHCFNGQCQGSSAGGQARQFVNDHRALIIGVCCGVGGLLLLSILCCIVSRCRRRGRVVKRAQNTGGWAGGAPGGIPYTGPPPPAWNQDPGAQYWNQRAGNDSVYDHEQPYMSQPSRGPPSQFPPSNFHSDYSPPPPSLPPAFNRQNSVRYA